MGRIVRLLAVACGLCVLPAQAQTARLTVLADSVSAGAPFEIAVTVRHAPGVQTLFPTVPPGDPSTREPVAFGDAEALDLRRLPPAIRGAVRFDSAVVRAVAFSADSARVGPIPIQLVTNGDTSIVRTGSAVVPVRSVLSGEAEPYEPAPVGPPETFASATPIWIALGLVGALLGALIVWGVLRMLRRPRTSAAVLPYPAAVAALDRLDRDAPAADAAPDAIEAHVVAARDVLRGYLADRLALPVREATTDEVDALLTRDARVPEPAAQAVRAALRPTDLVAFARVRPAPPTVARLRADTRTAIDAVEQALRDAEGSSDTRVSSRTPALDSPR